MRRHHSEGGNRQRHLTLPTVSGDIAAESNAVLAAGGDDLVNFVGASGTFMLGQRRTPDARSNAATNAYRQHVANTIIGNTLVNVINGGGWQRHPHRRRSATTSSSSTPPPTAPPTATRITDLNEAGNDFIRLENTGAGLFNALAAGHPRGRRLHREPDRHRDRRHHRIIYEIDTGMLRYDSNGSLAGGVIVHFATLDANKAALYSNLDFLVI